MKWELFHLLAQPSSAKARRYVMDHALEDRVTFRNVAFDEALAALLARGGHADSLPAVWDGRTLHEGAEVVLSRLQTLVNLGRED